MEIELVNSKLNQGLDCLFVFFSAKGKRVNVSYVSGHTVAVASLQLCSCSMKIATDNM